MRKKRLSKQQRPLWKRFVIMTGKVIGMLALCVTGLILMLGLLSFIIIWGASVISRQQEINIICRFAINQH